MPAAISDTLFALALPLAACAGVLLDRIFGEVARWHPLVGFGNLAAALERRINRTGARRLHGVAAWLLVVVPWVALAAGLRSAASGAGLRWLIDVTALYFALGGRSLNEHAQRVADDLAAGDLPAAREHVGWIVSRNTRELDETGVAKACVETVLENGNDAVFGALFWFMLAGAPGVVLFRLANTLDAMWGYRTERFLDFGWAAARLDDALNYLPARLTALSYALCAGSMAAFRRALACWRTQAPVWDSPNAGPVMASGAGALGIALGGAATYHGQVEARIVLGGGPPPRGVDVARALTLVRRAIALWLAAFLLIGVSCA
jgi:adenosylcobinamide-phosphate synthase